MATAARRAGFDAGPLSWVKHEIDSALSRGAAALAESGGTDLAKLRTAQAQLHQAHGALQIVGLDGITRLTTELEALLADMVKDEARRGEDARAAAARAFADIAAFLDGLVAGKASVPLELLPAYEGLVTARGGTAPDPVELYFPNLAFRPPPRDRAPVSLHPEEAKPYFRDQRSRYLKGLLAFLRNDVAGAAEMRAAVEAIESAQATPAQRGFWWVAMAFFDALAAQALPGDAERTAAKRLCNRIEQQIRALAEGAPNVAERLMREALYFVACATAATPHLKQVQETYQLAETLPRAVAAASEGDAARDKARETLARAREAWDRFATGQAEALPAFCAEAAAFETASTALDAPALVSLAQAMRRVGDWLGADGSRANEALTLEQATALLLAGSALQDASFSGADFEEQVRLVCARLEECMEGRLLRTSIDIPLLDEMSRRAQENLITEQALADMKVELRAIEQVLDRFFRNPAQRGELATLAHPLEQLDRSLALIGEAGAREALAACAQEIQRFSASDFTVREPAFSAACERVAATFSGLGIHLEALRHGPADFEESMRPAGTAPAEEPAPKSVEEKLATSQREVQRLAQAWSEAPDDANLRAALIARLRDIEQDAVLVADAGLQGSATAARQSLEQPQASAHDPVTVRALQPFAPVVQPPAPSAAAERVAETAPAATPDADAAVDRELLAVYLEEATEVLGGVEEALGLMRADPQTQGALVAVRRAFHTLKGSGRMVGLTRMGEAAWAVEQTLNLWLQEGRALDAPLFTFLDAAVRYFRDSVAAMQGGGSSLDEQALVADAERVRRGESPATVSAEAPAETPEPAAALMLADVVPLPVTQASSEAKPAEGEAGPPDLAPMLPIEPEPIASDPVAIEPAIPAGVIPDATASDDGTVELGSLRVSATLFTIFSGEAHLQLNKVKEEHETLKVHGVITDEMMRAVHTLAGISGTVQLDTINVFARAFERALERLALEPLSEEETLMVEQAVGALERMVVEAVGLAEPTPAPELLERLRYYAAPVPDAVVQQASPDIMVPEEEGALHAPAPEPPPEPDVEVEDGPPERRQGRLEDEIDPQLLPLFLEEAGELLPAIAGALRAWRESPGEAGRAQALKRFLHTLKGSARMAGAMALGELAHAMESRIEQGAPAGAASGRLLDELDASFDRLDLLMRRLGQPDEAGAGDEAPGQASAADALQSPGVTPADAVLRVRATLVDQLVNEAGEVAIARSRIEGEIRGLRGALRELTDNVSRLRGQLREIEIQAETQLQSRREQAEEQQHALDPLEFDRFTRFQELTRMMAESVNDVQTVQHNLMQAMDATDAALAAQARLNRDLQQDLMRVRMVPVASLAERMHRIVRQAAKDLGKRAALDLRGAQVELDRSVLERITAPLEHLLRNAVAHGIETPEVRATAHKPLLGDVRLEVSQEGNEVVLVLNDDGAGLDLDRILARARELGLPAAAGQPTPAEITDFIFLPGFSTATTVSETAGRGIGMDVVRNEVASLGGRVELTSQQGKGTRFAIYLPLTLAVTQAVLVRCGAQTHAIPTVMVEHVMKMPAGESPASLEWQGRRYRLHTLAGLLGAPQSPAIGPALVVRSGASSVAVRVDEILSSSQEIVVKAIGPHIARIPGMSGASVLGSGEIVLILNPVQLAAREADAQEVPAEAVVAPPAAAPSAPPLVMVVDDSLTVRKITGRLLERQGYRVATARDGVEALEALQAAGELPAALLVDVEMPRMDGYELTRNLRATPALAHLPVLMITSRSADKHQQLAREAGVDAYLGKPYQEDELLDRLARFVAGGRQAA